MDISYFTRPSYSDEPSGKRYNVIQVEPMAEEDALALLKTRLSINKFFEDDVRALILALKGISFAITYAAAYIIVRE
jgi:hypothetical protein